MERKQMGSVALVGAGPGNLGLLTLRGKELLEKAQVVVYDRLVGKDILALMPKEAEQIDVGKESGRHPVPPGAHFGDFGGKSPGGKTRGTP